MFRPVAVAGLFSRLASGSRIMKLAEVEPEVESETDADPFAAESAEAAESVESTEPTEPAEPAEVPPATEQSTESALSEAEHEHYLAIIEANREVKAKQYSYDVANSEAKACKKELELASLELSNLIAEGPRLPEKPSPQKELPFDQEQQPEAEPEPEAEKFDWASTPITDALKMTPKQQEKLEAIGIKTVGQFEFLRAGRDPVYPDGLRSINGFGEKTVDAFENDIVNWLAANAREKEPSSAESDD